VPDYEIYLTVYGAADTLGQAYATPPSVSGWPAYYQEPSFSKLWVNSAHIKTRFDLSTWITILPGVPDISGSNFWKVDALTFVDNLSVPNTAVNVIDDICDVFCPKGVDITQKLVLKSILTNGLPDTEWTIQYTDYQNNPGNTTFSAPVRQRVELVLARVFQMPEFHTM
jgi:hypothetical protein